MVTGLLSVPVPSWSIVSLVLAPSAATVTESLKLEVALYPKSHLILVQPLKMGRLPWMILVLSMVLLNHKKTNNF
jgi:hypothetical protein